MPSFAKGYYTPKNPDKYMGNKTPIYRSSWEFSVMRTFDTNPAILKWVSEGIKIPYVNPFTGQHTVYVPDFFIVYVDAQGKQHSELIEVKPEKHTFLEKTGKNQNNKIQYVLNQAKWAAAQAWASHKGVRFRIINESDLFHTGRKKRK
jgi:hypothetical protein